MIGRLPSFLPVPKCAKADVIINAKVCLVLTLEGEMAPPPLPPPNSGGYI